MDLQQRQVQDAVAAVTLAAQAAAEAVASLAGQMARSAAPVGAEGADRAGEWYRIIFASRTSAYDGIIFATTGQTHR